MPDSDPPPPPSTLILVKKKKEVRVLLTNPEPTTSYPQTPDGTKKTRPTNNKKAGRIHKDVTLPAYFTLEPADCGFVDLWSCGLADLVRRTSKRMKNHVELP